MARAKQTPRNPSSCFEFAFVLINTRALVLGQVSSEATSEATLEATSARKKKTQTTPV